MLRLPKMGLRVSIFALWCATLLTPGPAGAQTSNDPPNTPEEVASHRETLSLLRQKRFEILESKMSGFQHSYELRAISDERLLHEFRAFYDTDPKLDAQYTAWIAAFPDSYAALLARGIYYRSMGQEARGDRFISETSKKQLDLMSMYLEKAMRDYDRSLMLTEKPLISYHAILGVAMLNGGDGMARTMLDESVRIEELCRSVQVLRDTANAVGRQPAADARFRAGRACRGTFGRPAQILRQHDCHRAGVVTEATPTGAVKPCDQKSIDALNLTKRDCSTEVGTSHCAFGFAGVMGANELL